MVELLAVPMEDEPWRVFRHRHAGSVLLTQGGWRRWPGLGFTLVLRIFT
jgi:hypothetical protein